MNTWTIWIDLVVLAMSAASIAISIYVLVDRHKTIKRREAAWKEKSGSDWV